jgi:hypothetical protein
VHSSSVSDWREAMEDEARPFVGPHQQWRRFVWGTGQDDSDGPDHEPDTWGHASDTSSPRSACSSRSSGRFDEEQGDGWQLGEEQGDGWQLIWPQHPIPDEKTPSHTGHHQLDGLGDNADRTTVGRSQSRGSGDDDPEDGARSPLALVDRQMPAPARPNRELADPEDTCPYDHIRDHPNPANMTPKFDTVPSDIPLPGRPDDAAFHAMLHRRQHTTHQVCHGYRRHRCVPCPSMGV